jgi:hypothetical protein
MSRYDWSNEPRLDERRSSAPDVAKHGKKKNTRRWCRGKVGVEHQLEVRLDERTTAWRQHMHPDRPLCYRPDWLAQGGRSGRRPESWSWMCSHIRVCTVCGKIFDQFLGTECPDYTPKITVFKDVELQKLKDATRAE